MKYNAYLNLTDGKRQTDLVCITEKRIGDITAVFIDGISHRALNSEFGAGIEIKAENIKNWMADYRHTEFWCRPRFGEDISAVPDETQGLICKKNDGGFTVILPIVSEQYKCVLCGGKNDNGESIILAKLFSWYEGMCDCRALAFLIAEGDNPYLMLEKCAEAGLELLGTGCRTRKERRYPEIFEYLGWCSWDAFQIRVDEKSLQNKFEEFKAKEIPVRWAILDDMWGEVRDFYGRTYTDKNNMIGLMHASRLYSFKADPIRFPNGLKHCIAMINSYGAKVGIWHPTTGYWRGIDINGDIPEKIRKNLIRTENGYYIHSCEKTKAYEYYSEVHDYLRKCGAEFVKIDNQSMTRRFYKGIMPVGMAARQLHDGMEASVGQHFDNCMINCMGMASEDMWNRSASPVSRCSDDFQPEDKAWFTKHILQCAYNSVFQGQFYYCDWDMWWTDDGQAEKNSILRAISGGPIYISDTLDRSIPDVLKPLILSDGRILRCDKPAMPARDCLTEDPVKSGKIFKLQNTCNGSGLIAAFNLDGEFKRVCGSISPSDVSGLCGEEFAVYEHFSGDFRILRFNEGFTLELKDENEYRLYTVVPLKNGCGIIGRTDKLIAPATYKSTASCKYAGEEGDYACVENYKLKIKPCKAGENMLQ